VLQGTFETLPLPEVLGLLARSHKRGALVLEAGPASGVIVVDDGRCRATESHDQHGPVEHAPELLVRLVDLCFAAARHSDGSFKFATDEALEWECSESVDLDVAIDELEHLLLEWRDIQQVIPSLEARVRLSDDLAVDELRVGRDRWRLLVAIDGGRTVRDLVQRTTRPILDVCHELVELLDAHAITITEAAAAPPPPPAPQSSTSTRRSGKASAMPKKKDDASLLQVADPYGPGVEAPHPGPGSAGAADPDAPVNSKGEFLRVFSALRDA
jgi:Domain of unknown function (DUF4388)